MKILYPVALIAALLTFPTGCFRQEAQVARYSVPEMASPAAGAYLQNKLKGVPGVVSSSFDLEDHTLTVEYQSSTIRTMNIEEAIAIAGFTVNGRPANPNAKLPEGLK